MGRNKRFKILKTAIKKYGANTTTQGTAFYKFDQFDRGKATYNVTGLARGDDELVALTPFGMGADLTDKTAVPTSGRNTANAVTAVGLSRSELGLSASSSTDDYNESFIPAKIIVKTNGTKDTTKTPSQITGVGYKKVAGHSLTSPFGRKLVADKQFDRQLALYNLVEAATGNFSVTFTNERMYGAGG